jgi:hypothetical protein
LFSLLDNKALEPWAAGVDIVAALAVPFISTFWKPDPGPSIKDVLNKLDDLSSQVDQIQAQITAIQNQLTQLERAVHLGNCSNRLADLLKPIATINTLQKRYRELADDEAAIPTAANPATRARTLDANFAGFASDALGPTSNQTPNVSVTTSPLATIITEIDAALLGPRTSLGEGIIGACAVVGYDQWRATLSSDPTRAWLGDQGYYQQITDLVRQYENYEVQALTYLEEAAYYRAAQFLHNDDPSLASTLGPDQLAQVCALATTQAPDGTAARLCKSVSTEVRDTYDNMVAEWKLTGRPYSNGTVVLAPGSKLTGAPGDIPPILWLRDPARHPHQQSWEVSTYSGAAKEIDGLDTWHPATVIDWNDLEREWQYSSPGRTDASPGILGAMTQSKEFSNVERFFWIPQAQFSSIFERGRVQFPPAPPVSAVLSIEPITVRCFVAPTTPDTWRFDAGIACGPSWWSHYATATVHFEGQRLIGNKIYYSWRAEYQVPADQRTSPLSALRGAAHAECPLSQYCYLNVVNWLGSPIAAPLGRSISTASADTMPVTALPDNAACTNTFGAPKLCTASGPGYSDERFARWLDDVLPNPSQPSPIAAGQPTVRPGAAGTLSCDPNWAEKSSPQWGPLVETETYWTATAPVPPASASKVFTETTPGDQPINTADISGPLGSSTYRVTCTATARWARLSNTTEAASATYQVVSERTDLAPGVARVPAAPAIGPVQLNGGQATVDWTVGDDFGNAITSFTITPYLLTTSGYQAQSPITVDAGGSGPSPQVGAQDSWQVPVTTGSTYRFTVSDNSGVSQGGVGPILVIGLASALSDSVTSP